ncbi:MAG: AsmA-like C-terminal region-containing protein [Pseudomonadota bacterium]
MKWVWRLLAVIVVLIVVAVGALFLIPSDRIAKLATDRFEAATGRQLVLEGDIKPSVWPVLGVSTGAVRLENSDWAGPEPMFEATGVSIGIAPLSIFGNVQVTNVTLENPVLRIATGESGETNLDFGNAPTGGPTARSEPSELPTLDVARISGGTVIYQGPDGAETRLDDLKATLTFPDASGPTDLALAGRFGDAAFEMDGQIARLSDLLDGALVPVQLTGKSGSAAMEFLGNASSSPVKLDGALVAEAKDINALLGSFGVSGADVPVGLGKDALSLATSVSFEDQTLALRALDIGLDQNRIVGEATVTLGGPRPVVDADFNLGDFNLAAVETGGGADEDASGETVGWSTDPIDMSALNTLDGRIGVQASSLRLGTSAIEALVTETRIDNARSVTNIQRLRAYDGEATGSVVLNARNGFSTRFTAEGSAFAISRLLSELVGYDRIIAAGDLQLSVLGVGNTIDALMNSLDGEGSFRVGAGELLGLDIVGMLRNLDPSYLGAGQVTLFDEITGTFRIVDGVVINEDMRLTAPLFRATGAGRIGVGKQSIDFRFIPELLGGDNAGIKVPLLVTGSWQNPKVRLDLEGAISDRVEEEVREAIEKEVEKRLEEDLEDKIEDKLREGLGNLFGR